MERDIIKETEHIYEMKRTLVVRTTYLSETKGEYYLLHRNKYDGHTLHRMQRRYRPIHSDLDGNDILIACERRMICDYRRILREIEKRNLHMSNQVDMFYS